VSSIPLFLAFLQAASQYLSVKLCYISNYKGKLISGRQKGFSFRLKHGARVRGSKEKWQDRKQAARYRAKDEEIFVKLVYEKTALYSPLLKYIFHCLNPGFPV